MTEDRIIDTPQNPYFTAISRTAGNDWTDGEDFDNEIPTQLGWSTSQGVNNHAVYYQFWQGQDDPDDFASLRVPTAANATLADFFNAACAWTSQPAEGETAYLITCIVKDA